jgi:hypothetical protein
MAFPAVRSTLTAAPIDPALRFCDPVPDDPIADSATWADSRTARPTAVLYARPDVLPAF